MTIAGIVLAAALVMMAIEASRPGRAFPKVANWYARALLFNGFQALSVFTVGRAADAYFLGHARPGWSLAGLDPVSGALIGYVVHSFVY